MVCETDVSVLQDSLVDNYCSPTCNFSGLVQCEPKFAAWTKLNNYQYAIRELCTAWRQLLQWPKLVCSSCGCLEKQLAFPNSNRRIV